MKLATLKFDDMITIPGGLVIGDNAFADLTEGVFRAVDGWDLREVSPGRFTVQAAHMTEAHTVGGYGYQFTVMPPEPTPEPVKAKKR